MCVVGRCWASLGLTGCGLSRLGEAGWGWLGLGEVRRGCDTLTGIG